MYLYCPCASFLSTAKGPAALALPKHTLWPSATDLALSLCGERTVSVSETTAWTRVQHGQHSFLGTTSSMSVGDTPTPRKAWSSISLGPLGLDQRIRWASLPAWNASSIAGVGRTFARRRRLAVWIAQQYDISLVVEAHCQGEDLEHLPRLPSHHRFYSMHETEPQSTGGVLMWVAKSERWSCSFEVIFLGRAVAVLLHLQAGWLAVIGVHLTRHTSYSWADVAEAVASWQHRRQADLDLKATFIMGDFNFPDLPLELGRLLQWESIMVR